MGICMSLEGWEVSIVGEDNLCEGNSRSKGTEVGKCLRGSEVWDGEGMAREEAG